MEEAQHSIFLSFYKTATIQCTLNLYATVSSVVHFPITNALGLDPRPATLEVGDYVLSPGIVIERKSVPDLLGSFTSGRLYTQVSEGAEF